MVDERYDYIVCGAGTAGCLLANRLSADRSKRVLLIEAGGQDNYVWVHIPVGYLYCIGNPRTDWMYATEPAPGLNGRSLRYPRGKVLGGSSSINGMIYMRGQARDYDGWGRGDGHGANPGWSWDESLPYFLKHEDFHAGADAFHTAPGFDKNCLAGIREASHLHRPLIDHHLCFAARSYFDAELRPTHGERGRRTVHAIRVRPAAEMVDSDADLAHGNFEQLAQ